MRCNECILLPHTHLWIWLASLTQDQTAWDMFLSFHMGVAGLVACPRVDRPTRNIPAIPDGTLPLTTNHLNLHIYIKCLLLWNRFGLIFSPSFILPFF